MSFCGRQSTSPRRKEFWEFLVDFNNWHSSMHHGWKTRTFYKSRPIFIGIVWEWDYVNGSRWISSLYFYRMVVGVIKTDDSENMLLLVQWTSWDLIYFYFHFNFIVIKVFCVVFYIIFEFCVLLYFEYTVWISNRRCFKFRK